MWTSYLHVHLDLFKITTCMFIISEYETTKTSGNFPLCLGFTFLSLMRVGEREWGKKAFLRRRASGLFGAVERNQLS